jgi:hypothetical protein
MEPNSEWAGNGELRERIAQWTRQRGRSSRLYPEAMNPSFSLVEVRRIELETAEKQPTTTVSATLATAISDSIM